MSNSSARDTAWNGAVKEIRFRHWGLVHEPWRSAALLAAAACAAVLVARATASLAAGVIAWFALAVCFWRMWLPVHFEFGPRGVIQTVLGRQRRVAWRDIARCEYQRRGLLLHATDDATALGLLRSIYVHYPSQPEQLRELVEFELARTAIRVSSSSVETVKRPVPTEGDEIHVEGERASNE